MSAAEKPERLTPNFKGLLMAGTTECNFVSGSSGKQTERKPMNTCAYVRPVAAGGRAGSGQL